MQFPSDELISSIDEDLRRLGASCRVAHKAGLGQKWVTFDRDLTFRKALAVAELTLDSHFELGIFVEHPVYGGIIIWTTRAPRIANRLDGLP